MKLPTMIFFYFGILMNFDALAYILFTDTQVDRAPTPT